MPQFTTRAKVVCVRFDDSGMFPDHDKHEKATRGTRNVPTFLDPEKTRVAVLPDGQPNVRSVSFKHVYFQQEDQAYFHLEMPVEDGEQFKIGDEVTITVEK